MKSNQFTFISNLFVILLFSSLFLSLSCDAAVNYQITIQNPATICLEWMADLSFIYSIISHPIAFLLPLFFIFTKVRKLNFAKVLLYFPKIMFRSKMVKTP